MGNKPTGSTIISYKIKGGKQVSFIFYDLKGKNRFPEEPEPNKGIAVLMQSKTNSESVCVELTWPRNK